jgi:hypothetical protein
VTTHSSVQILPPEPFGGEDVRYAWKKSRHHVDNFWKMWSRDYFSALQARPKWTGTTPNLKEGQLVLLVDDQKFRDQWKRGRIEKNISEGLHVRRVLIRTVGGSLLERHVNKIVGLELD